MSFVASSSARQASTPSRATAKSSKGDPLAPLAKHLAEKPRSFCKAWTTLRWSGTTLKEEDCPRTIT
eukprot:876662-Amphidinium_carterae.1